MDLYRFDVRRPPPAQSLTPPRHFAATAAFPQFFMGARRVCKVGA